MHRYQDLLVLNKRLKRKPRVRHGGYKRLMEDLFLFSNQFAYVTDYSTGEVVAHRGFDKVLGYPPHAINMLFIVNEFFHPEDRIVMNDLVYKAIEWTDGTKAKPFDFLYCFDYRVKRSDNTYIRVLRQTTITETDDDGRMISTISICTDISHIKMEGSVRPRIERADGKMLPLHEGKRSSALRPLGLSHRETEILSLIASGKTSREVSGILHISVNTVNTHRRNMLGRTGSRNMMHLIIESIKQKII